MNVYSRPSRKPLDFLWLGTQCITITRTFPEKSSQLSLVLPVNLQGNAVYCQWKLSSVAFWFTLNAWSPALLVPCRKASSDAVLFCLGSGSMTHLTSSMKLSHKMFRMEAFVSLLLAMFRTKGWDFLLGGSRKDFGSSKTLSGWLLDIRVSLSFSQKLSLPNILHLLINKLLRCCASLERPCLSYLMTDTHVWSKKDVS